MVFAAARTFLLYGTSLLYFVSSQEVEYDNGYYVGVWNGAGNLISWYDAETYCEESMGTTLASIHSATQNSLAIDAATGTGANITTSTTLTGGEWTWIGLNDITTDDTWVWEDGTTFNYSNWATNPSQPQSGSNSQDCVHFWQYDQWADRSCDGKTDVSTVFLCNRLNIPAPSECNATWTTDSGGNEVVRFEWTAASFPSDLDSSDYDYELNYYADGGTTQTFVLSTSFTSKDVTDYDYTRGLDLVAGTIVVFTDIYTVDRYGTYIDCYSSTTVPTISPTDKPTNDPTNKPSVSPTPAPTWSTPYLYIGGDICSNSRCDCFGQSIDCVGSDIFVTWAVDSSQIVTFEQRSLDFGYSTRIFWSVTYLGGSNDTIESYSLNDSLIDADVETSIEIEPTSGYLDVSTNSDGTSNQGRESLQVSNGIEETVGVYYFELTLKNCSVNDTDAFDSGSKNYENCTIVYPNHLYIIVDTSDTPDDTVINLKSEEIQAWLWWVIAGAAVVAIILVFIMYRFWSKDKQAKKALAEKQDDLDLAIEEAENGWGGGIAEGNVNYNPMATGQVGNKPNQAQGYYGTQQMTSQQIKDRADVTIDKFKNRSEFGQIQPQRR